MFQVQQGQQQRQVAAVQWKRELLRRAVRAWATEVQQLQRSMSAAVMR
jgi:hypothetical protein